MSLDAVRRWVPLVVLSVFAVVAWQTAKVADVDAASETPIDYERELNTPILSARRIPETLRAPVIDAAVAPTIDALAEASNGYQYCLVAEVDDRALDTINETLPLVPASNQKIISTYAALSHFGPDHRFVTTVKIEGSLTDGVLDGDLYLIGGGDPYLSTANWWTQYEEGTARYHTRLEDLAALIEGFGINQITGSVIGDESLFDAERYGPWAERLINPQQQSGPLSALSVNQGYVAWPEVYLNAGSRTPTDNPPLHAADQLASLLVDRGVGVGGTSTGIAPATATTIAEVPSASMIEIITHINSYSDNYGAEILLKQLGLATSGVGSTAGGADAVRSILLAQGFDLNGVEIYDGSGLAETDRLTCKLLRDVLDAAGEGSEFAHSLSVGGERGSLRLRFDETPADGLVFAKTGTLNTVTALSGYVESPVEAGTTIIFAYIANGERAAVGAGTSQDFVGLQNPFVIDLTNYPSGPTIEMLDPEPSVPG